MDFLFIALIATIAIRVVNVVLDFSMVWAKTFWHIGVLGFLLYFLYRFRYDNILHRELGRTKLADKMLSKEVLSEMASGLALVMVLYADFFR